MHFRANRKPGLILVVKWSDPCLRVWIETQKNAPETFSSLSASVFSIPRFRGARHVTELVAGFPNHHFSSLNNQNCDQGTILKAKGSGFQLKKNFPIWMEALPLLLGLETKIGEGLFSNDPGLGFFFRGPRTTGRPPTRFGSSVTFC